MQCNIDAKGKAVRLILGLALVIIGFIAIGLGLVKFMADDLAKWSLGLGVGLLLAGAFCVFEGWAGWCVVRAMGFKTRI